MEQSNNYVVIFAGGIGSRFWPESRQDLPKQFLDILGSGQSLIQSTFHRIKHICPVENIYIITHESYKDLVKEHLPELPEANIVGEPFRKNTAPAAAYITYKIKALNPDANIVMCPSDHLILNEQHFVETVNRGLSFVQEQDIILTLGIKPTRPDTGYGYIQYETKTDIPSFHKVITFTEKPNLELARTFLKSGDFLWNSGIFIWNVDTFITAFSTYLPEMADTFENAMEYYNTEMEAKVINNIYSQCTNISIDYGIMEKTTNVFVIPSNFGWSDLGTWEAAYEHAEKDNDQNGVHTKHHLIIESSNNFIKAAKDKLVVVQGLDNYIVIDTESVLLICERRNEQEIKEYVAEIKRQYGEKYL